jgi:LPS export ABC transporter permease LptG
MILDRYLAREIARPFLLALAVFTFALSINPMLEPAKDFLAKGVPLPTIGFFLLNLLPQALGLTIPMAFLTGLLIALGRLSSDRESVAFLACGVSPLRLLRPVLLLGALAGAVDMYVLMKAVPDANQAFREHSFKLLTAQSERDIRPRVFFERFPNMVLFPGDAHPEGGWRNVLVADTSAPGRPAVTLAPRGRLIIDEAQRLVWIELRQARQYLPGAADDAPLYATAAQDPLLIKISPDSVFGVSSLDRGLREKGWSDTLAAIDARRQANDSPHNEIMHLHQMISFPVACLVFALCGLALGLNTRRDGKLAGLTLGLAVIVIYWAFLGLGEAAAKGAAWTGGFPAAWARWLPNIVVGLLGLGALGWRLGTAGSRRSFALPAWLGRLRRAPLADRGSPRTQSSARPVLVIRIPAIAVPLPRRLDRYVTGRYLRTLALGFVGLLALYYLGAFLDRVEKLFKGQADLVLFARFLVYSTPEFVSFVVPIATLVAVLGTIGALTRSGELTVMRACGISLYRTAAPLLVLALGWSALLFVLDDRLVARTSREAARLNDVIRGRPPQTAGPMRLNWWADLDGRLYHYAALEPERGGPDRGALVRVSVFQTTDRPFRLVQHVFAQRAEFENGAWTAFDGWTQAFGAQGASTRRVFRRAPAVLAPLEDFRRQQVDPAEMSLGELREYVQSVGQAGFNVAQQEVDLHRKAALPLITVVMTLLAIPFGVTTGRHGALYGIGLAIVLSFAYWLLQTLFVAMGSAALLPPALAAWATNILFASAAGYLLLSVRT